MKPKVEFEQPMEIKKGKRPKGYEGKYLFVETPDGEVWKARVTSMGSGANQAVAISVSQADADGKAKTRNGVAMVGETWTHTFTEDEWSVSGFDPEDRIMQLVEQRITQAKVQFALNDQVAATIEQLTAGE